VDLRISREFACSEEKFKKPHQLRKARPLEHPGQENPNAASRGSAKTGIIRRLFQLDKFLSQPASNWSADRIWRNLSYGNQLPSLNVPAKFGEEPRVNQRFFAFCFSPGFFPLFLHPLEPTPEPATDGQMTNFDS
jgi:hypothetical protein